MIILRNDSTNELFYATKQSAGFDLSANEQKLIPPRQWRLIDTGLFIHKWEHLHVITEVPDCRGYNHTKTVLMLPQLQILPRSGLALKVGITVLNAPGLVDMDYKQSIGVLLINHGDYPFIVEKGERIAQAVLSYVDKVDHVPIRQNDRDGGFGSTGT